MARIEIVLRGHLLVAGGQAADLGVDLATARRFDGESWVPYVPATAVRGAVRMQLEALLQARDGRAVSPYPETPPAEDAVSRLFGYSGPRRRRDGAHEGALRFGDALPEDALAARQALAVRPGIEIDPQTATASAAKLYFREVAEVGEAPLVFTAPVATGTACAEDLTLLAAAVGATDAVGAGKAKGGGAVTMIWHDDGGGLATTRLTGAAAGARRAILVLELAEPAHFGDGGPRGNHHATRTYVPGATVRGAVAWALLRSGRLQPESPEFRALFLDAAAPVSFGDALPCATGTEVEVAPATLRRLRGGQRYDDILVRELARERVNRLVAARGVYLRADDGADRFDPVEPRAANDLVRSTRTRVSLDRWQGVAADGRLFSIEQIEPWLGAGDRSGARRPARFVSVIEWPAQGAAAALRGLEQLAGLPLLVGAGRNHGLGQVRAELRFEGEPEAAEALDRLRALGRAVEREEERLARLAGLGGAGDGHAPIGAGGADGVGAADASRAGEETVAADQGAAATLLVALLAAADYVPSAAGITHPLAEPALGAAELAGVAPMRTFLCPAVSGGYDQIPGRPPLKALLPAVGAGSVFVYALAPQRLATLATELPALRRGVGQRLASGCGRFVPFRFPVEDRP